MSRAVKSMLERDVKARFGELESVLVVNVHGLTGIQANNFRGELEKMKVDVRVVKNSAARRALAGTPLAPLADSLTGPCAFVTGETGAVEIAKELLRLTKEYPTLELKTGIVDGDPELLSIEEISKRKSLVERQGEVIMLFTSPGRRIAGQLNTGGRVAGCIKAIIDKLEKGEAITKVA